MATSDTGARRIAVIGGGAKAAALAAMASILQRARVSDVEVVIFEKSHIGAAWSGRAGYTDGHQRLCTPVERDLGFPYHGTFGGGVDFDLYREFSWASYLLSRRRGYRDWVDGGRLPPLHLTFAEYLSWAVRQSKAKVVKAEVTDLRPVGNRWRVRCVDRTGAWTYQREFDGVVVSGPGPARRSVKSRSTTNVFNGTDFWLRTKEVKRALRRPASDQIVIVGAGGTAAAILAWFANNGYRDFEIVMVAEQAALYTRGDSVFENRLFTEDEAWKSLSSKSRDEFEKRLNRGVVWSTVMDQVSRASRVVFVPGRAKEIDELEGGEMSVSVTRGDDVVTQLRPTLVVDASGFDTWWFMKLIRSRLKGRMTEVERQNLQRGMTEGLYFGEPWRLPRLHAPFLCSEIGPGYGSLMTLGAMADRVLRSYATA